MTAVRASIAVLSLCACVGDSPSMDADADNLPPLSLVEELRIGSRDNPDSGFASISGFDVDRDGNVYVFEQQQTEIRVYDKRGKLARTIGRRGSGPGEFERFVMFWVLGDTVWTYEPRGTAAVISLFDRRGELLSTARSSMLFSLGSPGVRGMVLPRRLREDGLIVAEVRVLFPEEQTDTIRTPTILIDSRGVVVDTIRWDASPPPVPLRPIPPLQFGGTTYSVPQPIDSGPRYISLEGDRVTVATSFDDGGSPAFTITRLTADGDTVFHRRFRYSPRRYDDTLLDSLAWRSVAIPGGEVAVIRGVRVPPPMRPDSMAAFDAVRRALRFPEYQPPVQAVAVQLDGSIWLRREDDGVSPRRWLVVTSDGEVRGELRVPRSVGVERSRGDTAWGIDSDAADVPWLVRYRITRPDG